jgi:hypothetical protein
VSNNLPIDSELIDSELELTSAEYPHSTGVKTIAELHRMATNGIGIKALARRLMAGWDADRAITEPVATATQYPYMDGLITVKEASDRFNLNEPIINHHLRKGLSMEAVIGLLTKGEIVQPELMEARNRKMYEYQGKKYAVKGLIPFSKVSYSVLVDRLNDNWSVEDALTKPSKGDKVYFYNGKQMQIKEIAPLVGLAPNALTKRILRLGSLEAALNLKKPTK